MAKIALIMLSGFLFFGGYRLCRSQEMDERGEWRITPRLSVGATYSDNIGLMPANRMEGDIILQVDPGISIFKQGSRLNLRLDYTAQGLLYTNNGDANKINNNLLAFGTAELYENHLFLDAYGSITQVPISSGGRVDVGGLGSNGSSNGPSTLLSSFSNLNLMLPNADELFNPIGIFSNIALISNQTTQSNLGVSPYWRQRFGSWAEMLLRYRYADISYSESDNPIDQLSALSDSQINSIEFNLDSGRQFNVLTWNLNYFYQQQENQQNTNERNGNDQQELLTGNLNYRLNKSWALVAKSGYVNNLSSSAEDNKNGPYWGLGAVWSPNRLYSFAGLYGSDFNEVTVQFNPPLDSDSAVRPNSERSNNLKITRTYQGVGYNPGIYWNGSFNYRTPHSTWLASYTQEVTTAQQLASSSLVGTGPDGTPIVLDEQGQILIPGGSFGQTSQLFIHKAFSLSATYLRGRNSLGFNAFSDSREFQDSNLNQDIYGAGAIWTWRFAPRSAALLGTGWERDVLSADQQNDYWVSVIGLAHVLSPNSGGLVSYRYYQNDGNSASESFQENRLNIRFNMKF